MTWSVLVESEFRHSYETPDKILRINDTRNGFLNEFLGFLKPIHGKENY